LAAEIPDLNNRFKFLTFYTSFNPGVTVLWEYLDPAILHLVCFICPCNSIAVAAICFKQQQKDWLTHKQRDPFPFILVDDHYYPNFLSRTVSFFFQLAIHSVLLSFRMHWSLLGLLLLLLGRLSRIKIMHKNNVIVVVGTFMYLLTLEWLFCDPAILHY